MIRDTLELYSLNLENKTREQINPFTNEIFHTFVDKGFFPADLDYLKLYFEKNGWCEVTADGFRLIKLKKNNEIWFRDFDFPSSDISPPSFEVEYDCADLDFCELMLSLMSKTNSVVKVGVDQVVSCSDNLRELAVQRWKSISFVKTPHELQSWLLDAR